MGAAKRQGSREHIPRYPKGWIVLRILQLVASIIIIGLCGYIVSVFPLPSAGLMLFTCAVTLGISIWLVCAHSCKPHAFNYWAVLAFDLVLWVFWFGSFVWVALNATALFIISDAYHYNIGDRGRIYASIVAAAGGLGAFQFLFFFIAWITDAVVISRHRKAGRHCEPLNKEASEFMMQSQPRTYEAVPQEGVPLNQQETAYDPQSIYNPHAAHLNSTPAPYHNQQV